MGWVPDTLRVSLGEKRIQRDAAGQAEVGFMHHHARSPRNLQSLEEARKNFRGREVLPTPCFLTSGLQNCKTIHFHCFKPRSLWQFIPAALGNSYTASWEKQ